MRKVNNIKSTRDPIDSFLESNPQNDYYSFLYYISETIN